VTWGDIVLFVLAGAFIASVAFLFGQAQGWRQGWDDARRKEGRD
jgi:hypothetical protein